MNDKLKVVAINSYNQGSTGRIALGILSEARNSNYETFFAYGRLIDTASKDYFISQSPLFQIGGNILSKIRGRDGFQNRIATKKLIQRLKIEKPDLVHLHNLHGVYISIPMLFSYLAKERIPIVWTFHDCWPFTGHCPYFTYVGCEKWKTGCYHCPLIHEYPKSWLFDGSRRMWKDKKEILSNISNLVIVTPSLWLSNLVSQSFLKRMETVTINNGIDLSVFKPTASDFKEKNGLLGKMIILGVASPWSSRKGLNFFNELADRLDERYQVVIVGATIQDHVSPKIIKLSRIHDVIELVKIYSAADIFVNPTLEDNFPTVNIEALACGTPVISFDTGGCREQINDNCGLLITEKDTAHLLAAIKEIMEKNIRSEDCVSWAKQFDANAKFKEYVKLYNDIVDRQKAPHHGTNREN